MNMEQLKNAIEKIDDKYISEAEYFDPETMKIPRPAVSYTLPAAAIAASVALIVVTTHFTDFKHQTDNFEINNGFVVTDNTTVSETSENTAAFTTEVSSTDAFSESSVSSAVTVTDVSLEAVSFTTVSGTPSVTEKIESITTAVTKELKPVTTAVTKELKPVTTAVTKELKPVTTAVTEELIPVTTAVTKEFIPVTSVVTAPVQTMAPQTSFITDAASVSSENKITTVLETVIKPVVDTDKPANPAESPCNPSSPSGSQSPEESEDSTVVAPETNPTDVEILPSGNARPLQYKNYAQMTDDIKNYNLDKFPAVYRNAYKEMFERIKSDGFLYAVDDSPERPFSLTGSNILLIPGSEKEDTGTSCMVKYGNSVLQVMIYCTDKNIYSSADSQKSYIENRTSLKFSNVYHIGDNDVFAGLSGTLEYAASFIDDEHYCVIKTTGYRPDILDFAESSPFIKINLQ